MEVNEAFGPSFSCCCWECMWPLDATLAQSGLSCLQASLNWICKTKTFTLPDRHLKSPSTPNPSLSLPFFNLRACYLVPSGRVLSQRWIFNLSTELRQRRNFKMSHWCIFNLLPQIVCLRFRGLDDSPRHLRLAIQGFGFFSPLQNYLTFALDMWEIRRYQRMSWGTVVLGFTWACRHPRMTSYGLSQNEKPVIVYSPLNHFSWGYLE